MRRWLIVGALLFMGLGAYLYRPSSTLEVSYYYWKQHFSLSPTEHPKFLYIKCLDVEFDHDVIIHATVFDSPPPLDFIPVIYIENQVLSEVDSALLAQRLGDELRLLQQKNHLHYEEIQVDCDWTMETRNAYFTLIRQLKQHFPVKFSATIRLHQIADYDHTGIPPVDRGVLMYYNMSDFRDPETKNAILDRAVARTYHKNFGRYPLRLDIALPLYSQATIIRFGSVVGLMEGVRKEDVTPQFIPLGDHHYRIDATHYFKGRLLYQDDIVRIDEVTPAMLQGALDDLKPLKGVQRIIFFRWENRVRYEEKNLEKMVEGSNLPFPIVEK
jgi:hypothetical protein